MAQFMKIPLTGVSGQPEILVEMDSIVSIIAGDVSGPGSNPTTKTRIITKNPASGYQKLELTHDAAAVAGDVVAALNKAMGANPGGVISTVRQITKTAQVPQQPSVSGGDGRIVITTPYAPVTFTAAAWS